MGTRGSNPVLQHFKVDVPKYQNMIVKQSIREDKSNLHDLELDNDFFKYDMKSTSNQKK